MIELQKIEIQCLLCKTISDSNAQIKMQLVEIMRDLKTILLKNQQLEKINYISNENSFCLLMKCVLWKTFAHQNTLDCPHTALISQFLDTLKCSQRQLMKACEIEFSTISKRKYELDLVKNSLKNISERIEQISQKKIKRDYPEVQNQQIGVDSSKQKSNHKSNQCLLNQQKDQSKSLSNANQKKLGQNSSQKRKQTENKNMDLPIFITRRSKIKVNDYDSRQQFNFQYNAYHIIQQTHLHN